MILHQEYYFLNILRLFNETVSQDTTVLIENRLELWVIIYLENKAYRGCGIAYDFVPPVVPQI